MFYLLTSPALGFPASGSAQHTSEEEWMVTYGDRFWGLFFFFFPKGTTEWSQIRKELIRGDP